MELTEKEIKQLQKCTKMLIKYTNKLAKIIERDKEYKKIRETWPPEIAEHVIETMELGKSIVNNKAVLIDIEENNK